jgi:hypothetical protein
VHGAIPGPGEGGSLLGPVAGLLLLGASVASVVGLRAGRAWARPVLGGTGLAVAAGFLLYHAIPVKTALSYPYWGQRVNAGALQWAPVVAAIAVGGWGAWLARPRTDAAQAPSLVAGVATHGVTGQ